MRQRAASASLKTSTKCISLTHHCLYALSFDYPHNIKKSLGFHFVPTTRIILDLSRCLIHSKPLLQVAFALSFFEYCSANFFWAYLISLLVVDGECFTETAYLKHLVLWERFVLLTRSTDKLLMQFLLRCSTSSHDSQYVIRVKCLSWKWTAPSTSPLSLRFSGSLASSSAATNAFIFPPQMPQEYCSFHIGFWAWWHKSIFATVTERFLQSCKTIHL